MATTKRRLHPKLAALLKTRVTEHWGHRTRFTPRLLNKTYGDGKGMLLLFPINERPRYWVVRVDSRCNGDSDVFEIIDDIYEQIDEQFGAPPESDLGVGNKRPYFPMHDGEGTAWHFAGTM